MKTIQLTQGFVAIVDDQDYESLSRYQWRIHRADGKLYARRSEQVMRNGNVVSADVSMHRQLLDAPVGVLVDHRDGDGLNNCRSNLRLCNGSQNTANRRTQKGQSKYHGVCWNHSSKKWQAQIKHQGKSRYIGVFANEEDAAKAYDSAALQTFGDFAQLNFKSEAA